MWNMILDSWKSLFSLMDHKILLFGSRGKAQNANQMYCHLAIIAISYSRRRWRQAGDCPVRWSVDEAVWNTGHPRRGWQRKHIPCTQPTPSLQRSLGLVLRITQGKQEVGKRRKSKNNTCRGLGTSELDLPQLHFSEPDLKAATK